jgi:hypothetical protein
LAPRPWTVALLAARFRPARERGPVLLLAFARLAAICRSVAMVKDWIIG